MDWSKRALTAAFFLTESGKILAEKAARRHDIVLRTLRTLGVPEELALSDAEGTLNTIVAKPLLKP
ncbi:iron dependent repressor, metal binding and dimerization domain protein [Vibrio sp. PP-XX7]